MHSETWVYADVVTLSDSLTLYGAYHTVLPTGNVTSHAFQVGVTFRF